MIPLIPPISFGDLISMAQSFRVQFPFILPSPEAMQYWMAATLLRVYVKTEWCDDNLSGASAQPYLTPSSEAAFDGMKVQARIVALGEMVFNLQHVPGGPERIARISNSSLEVAVSEFQAARLLRINSHAFRFVPEQGIKGADYDIEISRKAGQICCESKCKLQTTALSEETILNSLREAADQLPSDAPGVVFVRVPESWARSTEIATAAGSALPRFFGRSGRTIEVVFHWEEWEPTDSGGLIRMSKYREEVNNRSRFFHLNLVPLFRPWSPIWNPPTWTQFIDAIRFAGPDATR